MGHCITEREAVNPIVLYAQASERPLISSGMHSGCIHMWCLGYSWPLDMTARCGGSFSVVGCNTDWLSTLMATPVSIIIDVFLGALTLAGPRALNRIAN